MFKKPFLIQDFILTTYIYVYFAKVVNLLSVAWSGKQSRVVRRGERGRKPCSGRIRSWRIRSGYLRIYTSTHIYLPVMKRDIEKMISDDLGLHQKRTQEAEAEKVKLARHLAGIL